MNAERPNRAVPLDEIIHYGQHIGTLFILTNGSILAADNWYAYNDRGTYKLYSGGDTFHIDQGDVLQMATREFIKEVVLCG